MRAIKMGIESGQWKIRTTVHDWDCRQSG
jgi:hypothetical protein